MPDPSDTRRISKKERQQLALERRANQVLAQKRHDGLVRRDSIASGTITGEATTETVEPKQSTPEPIAPRTIVSLDELLAKKRQEGQLGTPKFLSRKERAELAEFQRKEAEQRRDHELEQRKKGSYKRPLEAENEVVKRPKENIQRKDRSKKFQFEWDNEDDTTGNDLIAEYAALMATHSGLDPLMKEKDDGLHWSQKPLDKMKSRDWRIMKEDFEIITRGTGVQPPLRTWTESEIPNELLDIIKRLGYKDPTPIQRASIPIALKRKDIIGVAETGSGKTLAFLIPMLSKILRLPRLNEVSKNDGPYGLILVPTRELAQQIELELNKFLKYLPMIDTISFVGGKLIEQNILDLQNRTIEIVIATPGRLIDCLERHYLVLNQVKFLVLDESDKMIEMNFGEQVEKITDFISSGERQNMMFTATLTNEVENLSRNYVNDPAIVNIGSVSSRDIVVNERISQKFEFITNLDESKRIKRLEKIITSGHYKPPIIVFINYKETGEQLHKYFQGKDIRVALIHGSKSQDQREAALEQLKNGRADVLIATSVASRGIDVNNVSLVVNYQMTKKLDEYIHRIGRTGRAGNYGASVTFLNDEVDAPMYPELKRLMQKSGNRVPEEFKKLGDGMHAIV